MARVGPSWGPAVVAAQERCTDDGVKAAATSSMAGVTGVRGSHCESRTAYLPPEPFSTWGELVRERGVIFP